MYEAILFFFEKKLKLGPFVSSLFVVNCSKWALRTFRRRSPLTMKTIWESLIQSHLDYCCQLWSPVDQTTISKLENPARHFNANIAGILLVQMRND